MQDAPGPDSLLAAVAAFLREEAAPALPPHEAYQAKVAANAVDLVRRQLAAAGQAEEERARLVALLGREGALEDLTRALAEEIGAGRMDLSTPGLAEHLTRTTNEKIAVDQPRFGRPRPATKS